MRHRIKAGKVGSFTPEKQKVEIEQLENKEVAEDVEEIFEEDSEFSNDDEALAAMEFYDSPDAVHRNEKGYICDRWSATHGIMYQQEELKRRLRQRHG